MQAKREKRVWPTYAQNHYSADLGPASALLSDGMRRGSWGEPVGMVQPTSFPDRGFLDGVPCDLPGKWRRACRVMWRWLPVGCVRPCWLWVGQTMSTAGETDATAARPCSQPPSEGEDRSMRTRKNALVGDVTAAWAKNENPRPGSEFIGVGGIEKRLE